MHVLPLPEGDALLTERLPGGALRHYRKSGRPIGELIPVGMDVAEGLEELYTVEGSLVMPAFPATVLQLAPTTGPDYRDTMMGG